MARETSHNHYHHYWGQATSQSNNRVTSAETRNEVFLSVAGDSIHNNLHTTITTPAI